MGRELRELNAEISKKEEELEDLYYQRRGQVEYHKDGSVKYAWCYVCGKRTVNVEADSNTCFLCLNDM